MSRQPGRWPKGTPPPAHKISCRQRLRVYRKYMAEMIEMGVEASLKELAQEDLDGRLGNDPEGKAPTSGAGEV